MQVLALTLAGMCEEGWALRSVSPGVSPGVRLRWFMPLWFVVQGN